MRVRVRDVKPWQGLLAFLVLVFATVSTGLRSWGLPAIAAAVAGSVIAIIVGGALVELNFTRQRTVRIPVIHEDPMVGTWLYETYNAERKRWYYGVFVVQRAGARYMVTGGRLWIAVAAPATPWGRWSAQHVSVPPGELAVAFKMEVLDLAERESGTKEYSGFFWLKKSVDGALEGDYVRWKDQTRGHGPLRARRATSEEAMDAPTAAWAAFGRMRAAEAPWT